MRIVSHTTSNSNCLRSMWAPSFPHSQLYAGKSVIVFTSYNQDAIEFALYKKGGNEFIIADVFREYESASNDAKEILGTSDYIKQSILHTQAVLS